MAKATKKKTAAPAHAPAEKLHPFFESLQKRAAALAKKTGVKIGIAIAVLTLILLDKHSGGPLLSVLYIFANDGKVSGRMSGDVKMRNGRGRQFKVPALVRNAYTTIARTTLASFSSMWNSLTEAQRASWNASSGAIVSDRFAQPVTVKGKGLFVALNCNLFYAGQAPILVAPFVAGVSGLTSLDFTATNAGPTVALVFTPTPTLAGQTGLIFATAPQNPGIYRPSQSKFRLIGTLPAASASPFAAGVMYNAKFGAPAVGTKIFVQVKMVANSSGLESAITQADAIVT